MSSSTDNQKENTAEQGETKNTKEEDTTSDALDFNSSVASKDLIDEEDKPTYPERPLWHRIFGRLKKGALRGGIIQFTAFTIGVGCLTFPYVISKVGFIPGVVLLLFTKVSNILMIYLVIEVGLKLKNFNYNDIARKCIGKFWLGVYDICNLVNYAGVIMSYLTTSYGMVTQFADAIFHYDLKEKQWIMYVITCVCINIPLCMIKNLTVLQIPSLVATIAIIIFAHYSG